MLQMLIAIFKLIMEDLVIFLLYFKEQYKMRFKKGLKMRSYNHKFNKVQGTGKEADFLLD